MNQQEKHTLVGKKGTQTQLKLETVFLSKIFVEFQKKFKNFFFLHFSTFLLFL